MIPEALIVRARAVRIESELARRGVKLRRQSRIWLAGPCPLCGGDDRFSVNAARQLWHCRRCEVGGNVIQLVQHLDDLKFSAAVCLLAGESEERRQAPQLPQDDTARTEAALALWHQARDPRDTLVEKYLRSRGLELPNDSAEVIRFHPDCPFGAGQPRRPCMLALVRSIETNAPQAIHRTALNADGTRQRDAKGKTARLSLGPVRGGAIKLTADENVTLCLGVAEGVETALSMRLQPEFGPSPLWSLVCAGGFKWLPVLPGVQSLWVAIDNDPAGEKGAEQLVRRWAVAGREVISLQSDKPDQDLNDILQRRRAHAE